MKILYVLPYVPWPVKVNAFNLIPRLARRHEIHLVSVSNQDPSAEQAEWIGSHCETAVHVNHGKWQSVIGCALALPTRTPLRLAYCRSRRARAAVKNVCMNVRPDVVCVERWRALEFVPRDLRVPLVTYPIDSMTLYNRRMKEAGAWWEKLLGSEEHWKFSRYEGELARRGDVTVFCSRMDLECVRKQAPDAHYQLLPNGVDCESFFFKEEREEEPGTMVFAGSFRYRPNCHAVEYFLDEIFPLIRREVPQARFRAVGNGAGKALARHRGKAGFEIIDFVPDLRPYLAKAQVTVAPLTIGSGVSNKLGEGFAVGTPVVATPLACGDLPVKSGEEILIAENARDFAEHVVKLLKDPRLRRQMAVRARQLVESKYDWEVVSTKMECVMGELVEGMRGTKSEHLFATA